MFCAALPGASAPVAGITPRGCDLQADYSRDRSERRSYGRSRFSSAEPDIEGGTMSLRRSRIAVAAVMSSSLLAGLAVAESSGATTPDTTLPGTGEGPVGVIAIGHSGLTGENSDPDRPFQPALENSWATGTNPEVNSVYLRLVEVPRRPRDMSPTPLTAGRWRQHWPTRRAGRWASCRRRELVIIQTIDYDLQCPLDDAATQAFGETIADVLDEIVAASPQSRILMVGQSGRSDAAVLRGVRRRPSGSEARTHRAPANRARLLRSLR